MTREIFPDHYIPVNKNILPDVTVTSNKAPRHQMAKVPNALKYIVEESGNKTSVLVPVKVWEDINSNYLKLQNKLNVFNSLKDLKNLKTQKDW